ncbi:MAG: NACHT domain-containing protein [Pseudonocardiaceae bacterium]
MAGTGMMSARGAGWLALAISPAAVVGLWWDALMKHPVLTVGLLGFYESAVAAPLFAGKIVAGLREGRQERIVSWLDRALGQRISRFGQRYREFMLGSLRVIDLGGLATAGFHTPELDDVFVEVSLALEEPSQASGSLLAVVPAEVADRHSLRDFLDRPQPVVLAVIGAPGSGKTTLLRHTARQLCRVHQGRRRTVPILLYLREHLTMIASTPEVALPELVRGTLGRCGLDEPEGWFEQRLHDGACLVLLDGLDEVGRPEDRRRVAGWVEHQIRQYPKNDYVITSRPQGYRRARIDGAAVLQVRSFTDEQVACFLQGWYLAIERHSTGATGEDVRLRAGSAADDLLQRLNDAPALYELTVNPLLLTMIATVHRYRGARPGSRADLYGEICQVMLCRRREAKELPSTLDGDQKEAPLRGLAFAMMKRQVRDLPRAEVLAEIGPALHRMSRELTAEEFLTDIASTGLLVERESGGCSFAHLAFQEYLAAAHIRDKGLVHVLVDAIDDAWWRETTLLYTARSDADPIVRAGLAATSVTALSLALDCAEQSSGLAPELRDRLDDLLAAASAADTDPERRRLMAGVLLTRHLRRLIRTGNGGRVCARLITTGLYELYQHDTQGPAPERPTHSESSAEEPITGISGRDAAAFARWVNSITGSDTVYRLPNLMEMKDAALSRVFTPPKPGIPPPTVWLEPDYQHGQSESELFFPAGTNHPHLIDARTLVSYVEDDIPRSITTLIRLLLLRSVITIRVFARHLAPNRNHDRDRALTHALARALTHALDHDHGRALTHALVLDFDRDLAPAPVLDLDPDPELDRALSLDLALGLDRDRDLDVTRALGLARDLDRDLTRDLTRARNLARDLALDLDRALDLTRALDVALDRTLDRARDVPRAHDATRARVLDDIRARFMGSALAHALTRALHRYPSTSHWPAEFAQEFIAATGIAKTRYVVSLDTLADKVQGGQQDLVNLLGPTDRAESLPWAHQAAINLQETALPVFARQRPLTKDTATSIRLAALCLAAEADARKANQLGDTFREIAAGVTLLERRATGKAVPTETIMLALTGAPSLAGH